MFGLYFTQVNPDIGHALKVSASLIGNEDFEYFISTPGHYSTRLEGENVRTISILGRLQEASLDGILVHHPYRLFKDDFSLSLINHLSSMVKSHGYLVLPYTPDTKNVNNLLLDLQWLEKQLGGCIKNFPEQKLAAFQPLQKKIKVNSVFDALTSQLHVLTQKQNSRLTLDEKDRSILSEFIIDRDISKIEAGTKRQDNEWRDVQSLLSFSTYSIFGASYKTQSINKFISEFLPSNKPLKVLDIGGGLGFVDIELLLSNQRIDKLINCEPTIGSIIFNKFLFEYFSKIISGRYLLRVEKIEDFIPDEKLDIVCDFASLLYVPREKLMSTLESLWASLNKGGLLIIHENIKRQLFKEKSYYHQVFEAAELDKVLSEFGQIRYYRSSDFMEISKNQTKDSTVFRVVKK